MVLQKCGVLVRASGAFPDAERPHQPYSEICLLTKFCAKFSWLYEQCRFVAISMGTVLTPRPMYFEGLSRMAQQSTEPAEVEASRLGVGDEQLAMAPATPDHLHARHPPETAPSAAEPLGEARNPGKQAACDGPTPFAPLAGDNARAAASLPPPAVVRSLSSADGHPAAVLSALRRELAAELAALRREHASEMAALRREARRFLRYYCPQRHERPRSLGRACTPEERGSANATRLEQLGCLPAPPPLLAAAPTGRAASPMGHH